MHRIVILIQLVFLLSLTPLNAHAETEVPPAEERSSVVNFTRSIVNVYIVSEMCQQISSLHFDSYASIIKDYLGLYYHNNIPYWVLPQVQQRIKDSEHCIFMMDEDIVKYQLASRDFQQDYSDSPTPPVLSMVVVTNDVTADSASHVVTYAPIAHPPTQLPSIPVFSRGTN